MTKFKINRIIKYLVLSDFMFWSGWGLISPVFAIFIVDKIKGGDTLVVGIAAGIYWILKSILRIPIGIFLDSYPSEKDDYWFLTIGLFIASLTPFGFIFAKLPWHVYLLQIIYAIAMAMSVSGWAAIFTRHIDKGKEATEWGIDATSVGVGIGVFGIIGGWAVTRLGFDFVFMVVGFLGLTGSILLLCLKNDIKGVFDRGLRFDFKEIFQRNQK